MNLKVIGALALLVVWAIAAFVFQGPGWIHLILTIAVSLLIYGIVSESAPVPRSGTTPPDGTPTAQRGTTGPR